VLDGRHVLCLVDDQTPDPRPVRPRTRSRCEPSTERSGSGGPIARQTCRSTRPRGRRRPCARPHRTPELRPGNGSGTPRGRYRSRRCARPTRRTARGRRRAGARSVGPITVSRTRSPVPSLAFSSPLANRSTDRTISSNESGFPPGYAESRVCSSSDRNASVERRRSRQYVSASASISSTPSSYSPSGYAASRSRSRRARAPGRFGATRSSRGGPVSRARRSRPTASRRNRYRARIPGISRAGVHRWCPRKGACRTRCRRYRSSAPEMSAAVGTRSCSTIACNRSQIAGTMSAASSRAKTRRP